MGTKWGLKLQNNNSLNIKVGAIFFVAVTITMALFPAEVRATETKSYYWYHDSEKVELTLLPNHIVDFSAPDNTGAAVGRSLKPLREKPLKGGGKLLKLNENDFNEVLNENIDLAQKQANTYRSPLFKDTNGSVKAFAGGVLVKFKLGTTESAIKSLCEKNGLILKRKYSVEGQEPLWLISAPAGVGSLMLANNLMENHSDLVVASRPNFWQPINTRELKGVPLNRKRKVRR